MPFHNKANNAIVVLYRKPVCRFEPGSTQTGCVDTEGDLFWCVCCESNCTESHKPLLEKTNNLYFQPALTQPAFTVS